LLADVPTDRLRTGFQFLAALATFDLAAKVRTVVVLGRHFVSFVFGFTESREQI
jgi:hypothetical protein